MSGDNGRSGQSTGPAVRPLPGKPLGDLVRPVHGGEDELIRDRFLCRGGGVMLVAGTGLGKSVLVMMLAVAWAIGRTFAGLVPARSLRTWLTQGENAEGDLAEQRDGVLWGLNQSQSLTDEERKAVGSRVRVITQAQVTGHTFGDWLEAELQNASDSGQLPDILVLDPAYTFLGADASSQADVGVFLRNIIGPILSRFNLGLLLVHHAPKPASASVGRERGFADPTYAGAGSAEWANWPRGTLVLEQTKVRGEFVLRAGKNGHRVRWRNPDTGEAVFERRIAHSADEHHIYWRDLGLGGTGEGQTCGTESPSPKRQMTVDDVVPLADEPRTKADLEEHVRSELGIGRDSARSLLKAAVDRGLLEQADLKSFPRQTLIGLPGATSAEAARREAKKDAGKDAARVVAAVCPAPTAPTARASTDTPAAPAARPTKLRI